MMVFKICSHFSENVIFQKCIKTRTSEEILTFCVLISLMDLILHISTNTWPKNTFKSLLLVNNVCFEIFSPKLDVTLQILRNTVKLKSMGMQKISDKMYCDIIANRQKNIP